MKSNLGTAELLERRPCRTSCQAVVSLPKKKRTLSSNDHAAALLAEHSSWLQSLVTNFAANLPSHVDRDDLFQEGARAILECAERFDASRGCSFKTFALWRIRGAFRDHLRRMDWFTRTSRRVLKGRNVGSLDAYVETSKEEGMRHSPGCNAALTDRRAERGIENLEHSDHVNVLLSKLTRREAEILRMHDLQGLKLWQIARRLKVCESRVSQIRERALEWLRGSVKGELAG